MDCGEGTVGQMYRILGDKTEDTIMNIKLIWISHLHADHHLGLAKLLVHRQKLLTEKNLKIPLTLVSHKRMKTYLNEYQMICNLNYKLEFEFVTNFELENENHSNL
jgi:ribonuclease Z